MNTLAPGQLLGYTLQFPRAFIHLLKSGPGDKVSIEVLGDVATSKANGFVISEEDKSSIAANPITNRSSDLWKTFFNWMNTIKSGALDVSKTKFVLFCNYSGRRGIVNEFSDAQNHQEVLAAIQYAKSELEDLNPDHEIWKYFNFVMNENESLLINVLGHFQLEIGVGMVYDEIRYEVERLHVPKSQIEFIIDTIGGWLQKVVIERIKSKEKAILDWEDFNHRFLILFERARQRELIDFSLVYPPEEGEIENQVKIRPKYIRQLELIYSSDEEILESVNEYLRASVNRTRWIDDESIDEDIAADFESRLKKFWENQKKRIEITYKTLSAEEQGQLLLGDCKSRNEMIWNINPPGPTIAGTYHALADEPVIGWHPNWEKLFLVQKEE